MGDVALRDIQINVDSHELDLECVLKILRENK